MAASTIAGLERFIPSKVALRDARLLALFYDIYNGFSGLIIGEIRDRINPG